MHGARKGLLPRFLRGQHGGVAVEFAILAPIFILLLFGIVDFGHAWYMQHEITSASREGARYATRYQTTSLGIRIIPVNLVPSIANYIKNTSAENGNLGGLGLHTRLPADCNLQVTPAGPGYTSGTVPDDLSVMVTARKNWFVLGYLIPGFGSYKDLTATTVMKCE
jgi:Flp pilus assembly protein TadG